MAGGGSSEMRDLVGLVDRLGERVGALECQVAGLQEVCRLSPAVVLGPSAAGVRSAARAATDGGAVGVVVGATVPPRKRVK